MAPQHVAAVAPSAHGSAAADLGTAPPTRTIERDGRPVRQFLRPTAYGPEWFDEEAVA